MLRPFRHPVNATDRPPSAPMAEGRITVKAINLLRTVIIASRSFPAPQQFGCLWLDAPFGRRWPIVESR
jgi:hypothetical protein